MGVKAHSDSNGRYHNKVGIYVPLNKEKFVGTTFPQYKSLLERAMMAYLDKTPQVIHWSYEPRPITYKDLTILNEFGKPGKQRKYYIDFVAVIQRSDGKLKTVWIEVKSDHETREPSKNASSNAKEIWIRNNCKWAAARRVCESRGYEFLILTDKQLLNG